MDIVKEEGAGEGEGEGAEIQPMIVSRHDDGSPSFWLLVVVLVFFSPNATSYMLHYCLYRWLTKF